MTSQHNGAGLEAGAAPAPTSRPSGTVHVGDVAITVERLSGLKLTRILATARQTGDALPQIMGKLAEFEREYARTNVLELDRATALMRYGPRPLLENGEPVLDEDGRPRMIPGPLAHVTDADWQARGNVLRLPAAPSTPERVVAVFSDALELAEDHVYRLIALLATPNRDVVRAWKAGTLDDELAARVDELLEAPADDLLELAVVAAEVIDDQFRRKVQALGGRLGNLLRLVGMDPAALRSSATPTSPQTATAEPETDPSTGEPSSSSTTPTSSTDSPSSTDGRPTSPSELPPTSSMSSEPELELAPSSSTRPPEEAPQT